MENKFSFIFLGRSGTAIKQLHCSRQKFTILATLFFIGICAMGYVLWDYAGLHRSATSKEVLERRLALQTEEVIHQREQIQQFAKDINDLKDRLVQLDKFEERVRIIANLNSDDSRDGLFGVGGSTPDDLNPEIELTHRHQRLIKDMHQQIGQIKKATDNKHDDFECLLDDLQTQKNMMAHTPAIRPVDGWVTSKFGYRISPFTGKREFHKGWDIANRKGTRVVATADGVVSFAGKQGTFGQLMVIDHGHGITTRYAHLSKYLCKKGQRVTRGEPIAKIGNTGRSTGPHLHYEVRLNGIPVNPAKYILN